MLRGYPPTHLNTSMSQYLLINLLKESQGGVARTAQLTDKVTHEPVCKVFNGPIIAQSAMTIPMMIVDDPQTISNPVPRNVSLTHRITERHRKSAVRKGWWHQGLLWVVNKPMQKTVLWMHIRQLHGHLGAATLHTSNNACMTFLFLQFQLSCKNRSLQ